MVRVIGPPASKATGVAGGYTRGMRTTAKVMISLPLDLLERIDRAADERQTTRSGFLQAAARHELGWPDATVLDAAVERGRAALAGAGRFNSAVLIRDQRDARDADDRRR